MDIITAAKILNNTGKQVTVEKEKIIEVTPPFENYHYLRKKGEEWEYGLMLIERQEISNEEVIKSFKNERDAAKYFVLDSLSAFYFAKDIRPFMMKNDFDIGGPKFDETKFNEAVSILGIPSNWYSLNGKTLNENRIIVEPENEYFKVKFTGESGRTISSTLPVSKKRALFFAFKKLFLLHLFNKEVYQLFKEHGEGQNVTDEDIEIFLH
ncbi:hypothetical protein D3H55_16830 [Bacillus salacetis]|uniref:Uncharacterized protein n=1 Tax=Bacillus salacetis TaxID=2315464 RepID=A0A3A1QXD5_9BACI|nr:hypothetical protein [Bacillus salacetis]RIW30399.1 hypothetical protein D3H55_16830 [Bacillus salacetis]